MKYSILCILFLAGFSKINSQENGLLIKNVNIIDVINARVIKNVDVAIIGNRISFIGSNAPAGRNTEVIDGKGKYLVPGLWDMHGHVRDQPESILPEFFVNGVTGIRETGNGFIGQQFGKWKDSMNRKGKPWPQIMAEAGYILDGQNDGRGNRFLEIHDTVEARQAVQILKKGGADFVKVYDRLTLPEYLAIAEEAKKQNMMLDGHPPVSIAIRDCIKAGQHCFEHLDNFHVICTIYADSIRKIFADSLITYKNNLLVRMIDLGMAGYDTSETKKIADLFKENECWLCPTIVIEKVDWISSMDDSTQEKFFKDVPKDIKKKFKIDFPDKSIYTADPFFLSILNRELEMLAIFHKEGVKIIAGTDASPIHIGIIPGFSLQEELFLYTEAGFAPLEALRTATIDAATFLNKQNDYGSIEKGKIADMVLLDDNPLLDIHNIRHIRGVCKGGKYYDRETLDSISSTIVALK